MEHGLKVARYAALDSVIASSGQCVRKSSLRELQTTHGRLIKSGLREPTSLWNNLLKGYTDFERPQLARLLFDEMPQKDAFSWNMVISGLARCGWIEDARRLFDENPTRCTISWNCMMSAYNSNGRQVNVLKLFVCMHQEGSSRSRFSFATVLNACAKLPVRHFGEQVHADIIRNGLASNHIVGSALIRVYSAYNMLGDACQAFQEAKYRDGVLWTSIISAHAQNEDGVAALHLFQMMEKAGQIPSQLTFASVIDSCASLAALKQGIQIHARILKSGYGQKNLIIATALISMYSRCGYWNEASQIFDSIQEPDTIMWNAVIWGAALNGQAAIAMDQFRRMSETKLVPNHSTFSGVLLGCTYGGLVDEGMVFYKKMTENYGLQPLPDHCASMISLLGRHGQLDEAVSLMQSAPFEPNSAMWGALLGASVIHHNLEWGKKAAESLFLMEPLNSTPYVQLANIYASAGMWAEAAEIRKGMKSKGIKKVQGCSWIYIRSEAVLFTAGDRSHAKSPQIYDKLRMLNEEMKAVGYVPDRSLVFQDVDEGEKEEILAQHSEKLALALGLLELSSELPLWIVNNQRMCANCHTAFQLISKISKRKITVRDTSRFHNFEDGSCSCRNFW
ncbi:pentatricopeptide repeat-containing protein At1g08070, chloroplastic-like [Nymphaea colorata]|uniref:DYW domain-containing protein n=1 Tax=Nymphaea colorata TaxID=210225 RepID=A0A5K1CCI4_9MAGN|nr:pentatricopeptide repeat-containing protein At1g08070, chloroplastic-like [Nymphaea colorata]